jgi:hypothetical protein
MQKILSLIFVMIVSIVYADETWNSKLNESKTTFTPLKFNHTTNVTAATSFKNLDVIDRDSNDINELNRKLQVEKVTAEIRKLKNSSTNNGFGGENAQTVVTGVAINVSGKKIAWIQFADGGAYMVNLGSRVGKYVVTDISMDGVTLSEKVNSKNPNSSKIIFLKRVYASANKKALNFISRNNTFFTPSPIITSANSSLDYVPPIVPLSRSE